MVRDKRVHEEVIEQVVEYASSIDLYPVMLDFSPVKGPEGNIEYLLFLTKDKDDELLINAGFSIHDVVEASHDTLDR